MKTVVFQTEKGYTVIICNNVYEDLNQQQYDSLMHLLSTDSTLNSANNK